MSDLEDLLKALRGLQKPERTVEALLTSPDFARAVELMSAFDDDRLIVLATVNDRMRNLVALEALAQRPPSEEVAEALYDLIDTSRGRRAAFLLRALDRHAGDVFLTAVLTRAPPKPWEGPPIEILRQIAERRRGEPIMAAAVPYDRIPFATRLVSAIGDLVDPEVRQTLDAMQTHRDIENALRPVARVRSAAGGGRGRRGAAARRGLRGRRRRDRPPAALGQAGARRRRARERAAQPPARRGGRAGARRLADLRGRARPRSTPG